jgi:hypothetical protein
MNIYAAIDAAKAYAAKWGVELGRDLMFSAERPWWFAFRVGGYEIAFRTADGCAIVEVRGREYTVRRFEYYPAEGGKRFMVPLWAAYPHYDAVTIHWRMGYGEAYAGEWSKWYERLTAAEKAKYQERFPPPTTGAWSDFYEFIETQRSKDQDK